MRYEDKDIARSRAIEKQVERWDLFAKIAPTAFLLICFLLLTFSSVSFETVFFIGMVLFAFTAVTWWFWTIFSIRFLVKVLHRASTSLVEVTGELSEAKKELKAYVDNEKNNRS